MITTIVILISLSNVSPFVTTTYGAHLPSSSLASTSTIIDAGKYNLDITGISDSSGKFQEMVDSLPIGATLSLPKGTYKLSESIKLKDGMKLIASNNNVKIKGIGNNTLFWTGNDNTFQGIEFQNCDTAISLLYKKGLSVISCGFTNNISYAAVNLYGGRDCFVKNSYFYDVHKFGVLIDKDSSNIKIDNNNFNNAKAFDGFKTEQIGGHVYCLNADNVKVTNNIIKNSGGQGVFFGYNSTTGKGTTNSVASNNFCSGNGQEGATIYGGESKVTSNNSLIGNVSKNNRYNQIEVWQSDNNIVKDNTVEESLAGTGNLGAICLFTTTGTTVSGNKVLQAQSNGINITAGSLNCTITDNYVADTNAKNNSDTAERGNAILLDSNGISQPKSITIKWNEIISSSGIISKSGIYSTSNINQKNKIDKNKITGYKYALHSYANMTREK